MLHKEERSVSYVVWEKLKIECVCLHLWQSVDQLVYQSNLIKKELETCNHVSKSDWVILPVQHTEGEHFIIS
jgi:hypothetical protein